ncbi:pilus assembly protein PilP [Glaciimonas sp. CA11.2]|uniref:pilus assembly protein PilP n=1 Tax=unclassified Glaciimonas TaxID=2644401 RepID=UPI002AB43811|nr:MULTISPECIES: pilus assembly protein PilP [unclassified Glaciimonas]MDY7545747.1 pilus assembly protein PilP [Glaciimonas sp. CA11.2]MEB0011605.1 pilus assembly protein PilP [Glaciimonas sp. Cout2]MEB0081402.1 pilus assembly protein PilP [Glaciimonas sp. Gout2]MEB0162925.1 pilus assembly protein PilP [Glaciimonas sp. CA11.2]
MIPFPVPSSIRSVIAIIAIATLSGCGDSGVQEVREWMADVKMHTRAFIPQLTEPKRFIPFIYAGNTSIDPFDPNKLLVVLAKMQANSNGLKPNLERRREALENYPLDTIKMVGTLQKVGLSYALLQIDKTVFPVKVGNYVGQNFGMVTHISETEVSLKEIVQDASGEWVEREAKLVLQESIK